MNKRINIHVLVSIAVTLALIILLNQCSGTSKSVTGPGYKTINSSELKTMMADKDFTLINVHIPYAGDIPGTDQSIPYNEIGDKLDLPKDSKIVLYCRSGSMSKIASEKLVELGYTNVFDLKDGMNGWRMAGNEIISTPDR
jgi:rhodanese-related sulfurtransferase